MTDDVSEARFTAPTPLCPHPEWWTSQDVDSSENEVGSLLYGLVRGLQPRAVLETGSAYGITAEKLADALVVNGHGILYTIEADPVRARYAADRLKWDEVSVVIGGNSLDWIPPEDTIFDLCFFDSQFNYRVPEYEHFRTWMRPGTIVCFHDTAPGHGGTEFPGSDIRSEIARNLRPRLRMIHLPTPRGLTIGEVLP